MLERTCPTLPSHWYFDAQHHQRELDAIWFREWVCVGRESEWDGPGAYRVFTFGDQQAFVTRTRSGALRAFHNTCRHRGSSLCLEDEGRFRNACIVCPYHAWAYSLEGELLRTPRRPETQDFDPSAHSLYPVALETWRGFVFLNFADCPGRLSDALGDEAGEIAAWPLERLDIAHRVSHDIACNWKVFWENFQECYHCPGVHPDLGSLVPLYGQGLTSRSDLPPSSPLREARGMLRPGAVTWSDDGRTDLPWFSTLDPDDRERGQTFACLLPSMFVIAHVDYVRTVRVSPLAPERTRITVDWLLERETLQGRDVDTGRLVRFGHQVVLEDARICEINQRGLRCRRHAHGTLLPQEYDVLAFDEWVRQRLGEHGPG